VTASARADGVGASAPRREDERFLRGGGRFLDDLPDDDALHVAFVRSPVAHAFVNNVDVSRAAQLPGVVFVLTCSDLGALDRPVPCLFPHPELHTPHTPRPLISREVCHAGQPIAMVLAHDRYVAEDARDLVTVEFERLPAVVGFERALAPDAALVGSDRSSNVAVQVVQTVGDPARALAQADHVFSERLTIERRAAMPMETRGVMASFDPRADQLTVWESTQSPLSMRRAVAGLVGLREQQIRVAAPDMGGGLGSRGSCSTPSRSSCRGRHAIWGAP
jgi:CO/xanthine dehydrogenase Mo-binding subunit